MSFRKHIPNAITCCNLISGCIATCFAFFHEPATALAFIVAGAVFDFFDGLSARLLRVSSPVGKELDSLADVVTFGVAPSAMVFSQLLVMEYPPMPGVVADALPFAAFVMAAFSALRLAKFNLDERQTMGFIGLPTPANALFWGSLIVGAHGLFETSPMTLPTLLLLIAAACYLLIAEIPMFALKFSHRGWKGNEVRYVFLLSCIPLLLIFRTAAFAVIIVWYVVLSAAVSLYGKDRHSASSESQ